MNCIHFDTLKKDKSIDARRQFTKISLLRLVMVLLKFISIYLETVYLIWYQESYRPYPIPKNTYLCNYTNNSRSYESDAGETYWNERIKE